MPDKFREIDSVLRRANKIYLSYTLATFIPASIGFYAFGFSRAKIAIFSLALTLPISGIISWIHIARTFKNYEVSFLLAGLDPEYQSIKDSQESKAKTKEKASP